MALLVQTCGDGARGVRLSSVWEQGVWLRSADGAIWWRMHGSKKFVSYATGWQFWSRSSVGLPPGEYTQCDICQHLNCVAAHSPWCEVCVNALPDAEPEDVDELAWAAGANVASAMRERRPEFIGRRVWLRICEWDMATIGARVDMANGQDASAHWLDEVLYNGRTQVLDLSGGATFTFRLVGSFALHYSTLDPNPWWRARSGREKLRKRYHSCVDERLRCDAAVTTVVVDYLVARQPRDSFGCV